MTRRHSTLMLVTFAFLMGVKLLLLLETPLPSEWGGDAHDYISKAVYLREHGAFPSVRDTGQMQWPDFRPPGYSLFLAPLLPVDATVEDMTFPVRISQFGLDLLTTLMCLIAAWRLHSATLYRWIVVLVLGIQPWTSAYIVSVYPDTLVTFLTLSGMVLLAAFVTARREAAVVIGLLGGSLLVSLTFFVRPEMILFALILIGAAHALALGRFGLRRTTIYAVLSAIPFLAVVGANVAYRWTSAGELRIFGEFRQATPGLTLWSRSWIGPQRDKESIVWGPLLIGSEGFAKLPDRAFADDVERQRLASIVDAVSERGWMTQEEDCVFKHAAEKRIADDPLTYFLWNRIYVSLGFWLNLGNAPQYLHAFSKAPRPVSMVLTASFFGLKVLVFGLFLVGAWLLLSRRLYLASTNWVVCVLLLGAVLIAARTVYFGVWSAWGEYRYAVIGWPSLLLLAFHGLSLSWGRVGVTSAHSQ